MSHIEDAKEQVDRAMHEMKKQFQWEAHQEQVFEEDERLIREEMERDKEFMTIAEQVMIRLDALIRGGKENRIALGHTLQEVEQGMEKMRELLLRKEQLEQALIKSDENAEEHTDRKYRESFKAARKAHVYGVKVLSEIVAKLVHAQSDLQNIYQGNKA